MRFFKYKTFIVTSVVCLLPIAFGLYLWNKLPDYMAIHFDLYNNPDNFVSKEYAVFLLPVIMAAIQFLYCVITDYDAYKYNKNIKFEYAVKWIIPLISVALQIITICFNLGFDIDIRRCVMTIVGVVIIITGFYITKLDYIKKYNIKPEIAKKTNRFVGLETVFLGVCQLISCALPTEYSVVSLILFIPYIVISVVYGIYVCKKQI